MRGEIVAHQLAHGLAGLYRAGGVVRLQEYIRKLEEPRVQVRLALEDIERCRAELPTLREVAPGTWSACHRADELTLVGVT